MVEVPQNAREMEYLAARVRLPDAPNAADLLRSAWRSLIDPVAEKLHAYDAWRDSVRRAIDEAHGESFTDDGVDREEFREQLRLEIEAQETDPT